jgi:hypothetical protein
VGGAVRPAGPVATPKAAAPVEGEARPIRPGEGYGNGDFATPITAGDTEIVTMGVERVKGLIEGSGAIVGRVHNKHKYPLAGLEITVAARNDHGKLLTQVKTNIRFVPADTTVPFSGTYKDLESDNFADLATTARAVKADPTVVCWMVGELYSPEYEKQVVIFRNKTTNETGVPVKNVKVYCDFFNAENIWVGSAEGTLDERMTSIMPDKVAHFTVRYDTADKDILREAVHHAIARVVGERYSSGM